MLLNDAWGLLDKRDNSTTAATRTGEISDFPQSVWFLIQSSIAGGCVSGLWSLVLLVLYMSNPGQLSIYPGLWSLWLTGRKEPIIYLWKILVCDIYLKSWSVISQISLWSCTHDTDPVVHDRVWWITQHEKTKLALKSNSWAGSSHHVVVKCWCNCVSECVRSMWVCMCCTSLCRFESWWPWELRLLKFSLLLLWNHGRSSHILS